MQGHKASEHLILISVLNVARPDSKFLKVEAKLGFPTGLSIGQRHSEYLLRKLSEEVYPDYLLCENQHWGKRKCLCSDKVCGSDGGPMSWARDKKWEGRRQNGAG